MNIKEIGKLLSEYASGVIILDNMEKVIWFNNRIKKIINNQKIINKKFKEVFKFDLETKKENSRIIHDIFGKKYYIKIRSLKDKDNVYIFVLLDELTDFDNRDTKLYCLEKIIESIDEGIMMSDYEGRIVLYNKAHEVLEEMPKDEMVGKYLWEAYKYHNKSMSEHQKVYKTGSPVINGYMAHAYKNGIPKYVSYNTYPIVKDGETVAIYSISKNETMLQSLLSETIELKRQLFSKGSKIKSNINKNGTSYTFPNIIGDSKSTKDLIKEAQTVALLDNNILIVGETGTGKEVLAQSIHNYGKNHDEPFVAINCAAIPENLLESILFGTEKGSYTGAVDKVGLFEQAGNGTLFLDELNSMPISMQSKLLRVLQEKKVRRVGGLSTMLIQCRIISAISENPKEIIQSGKLRQDLFYRVAGFCLNILPLRERPIDILGIAKFFVEKHDQALNKNIKSFSKELKEIMVSYKWPGNVRELEHIVENLMVKAKENQTELTIKDIPSYLKEMMLGEIGINNIRKNNESLTNILRGVEKRIILESLNKNEFNISRTARDLGIIRQSLKYRMKKLEIEK